MPKPTPSGLVNIKIFAAGSELSGQFQIYSVEILKQVNRISMCTVKFFDGETSLQKFELSDKSNLDPGTEIEIKAGFDTDAKSIYKGIITKHSVKVRAGSSFTIVECKDKAVKMTIETRSEIYEKKKDSDIIQTLIGRASGVSKSVEATTYQHSQILQYEATDWDFMIQRAELNGKIVTTINNKVTVEKPKISTPKLTLEYGTNIFEFEADLNAETQISKVTATSWDVKTQAIAKKVVSSATFSEAGNITSSTLAGKLKTDGSMVYHSGNIESSELNDWGTAKMLKSKMSKLRGRVKSDGFADINPADTLEIKGVGNKFNGKVFVSAVRHEICEGNWSTDIQFGLSPEFHTEKFNLNSKQAGGLIPSVHGLQIGKVKKINGDPDNQNKIQVSLPVFGSKTNVWARMAFADAGNDRGLYFIPEVNDEVIIGFLNDDARFPVILGALHSSTNKTPFTTDTKNKEKGIVTKSKLKMTFNDTDKIFTVETPAKHSIELNDKTGAVTIKDKTGNKITMKSGMIELNGKGDITIKANKNISISGLKVSIDGKTDVAVSAVNIKNTAKAQFKASGNAQAEVSSMGQASLKATGIVNVQGTLVKIN